MATNSVYESLMKQAKDPTYSVRQSVLPTTERDQTKNIKYELIDSKGNIVCVVAGMDGNGKAPDWALEGVWIDDKKIAMERDKFLNLFGQLGYRFALPNILAKRNQNA